VTAARTTGGVDPAALRDYVARTVAAAPPLSRAQLDELTLAFRTSRADQAKPETDRVASWPPPSTPGR